MDTGVAFPSRPQADAVNLVPEPPQWSVWEAEGSDEKPGDFLMDSVS